jgi:hypothetical protein
MVIVLVLEQLMPLGVVVEVVRLVLVRTVDQVVVVVMILAGHALVARVYLARVLLVVLVILPVAENLVVVVVEPVLLVVMV